MSLLRSDQTPKDAKSSRLNRLEALTCCSFCIRMPYVSREGALKPASVLAGGMKPPSAALGAAFGSAFAEGAELSPRRVQVWAKFGTHALELRD